MSNGFAMCDNHTYLFATESKDCPYCEISRLSRDLSEITTANTVIRYERDDTLAEISRLKEEVTRLRQYEDAITAAKDGALVVWNLMDTNSTVIANDYWQSHLTEIDRLKAELESKDKAIKLLQGHCNALMDTEGKLAQWKKGHTAGQEAAGYYQKQADDMIRQLRKELSDENANFTEEIMNLELQLSEARAEMRQVEQSAINFHEAWQQALNDLESARNDRAEALRSCNEAWIQATGGNYPAHTAKIIEALRKEIHDLESVRAIHGNSCFTCKDCTIKELQRTCAKMREERKAFCEALIEITKIRLEPGYCYEQAVRMQEIAKTVLRRGEG